MDILAMFPKVHYLMFIDMVLHIQIYLSFFPQLCSAILGLANLNKILSFPLNPFRPICQ